MSRYQGTRDFEHGAPACTGILLTNLGTPEAPTAPALRRYLAEFLWDPRVVEAPRALWWPVLHGIILRSRPRRSAHAYWKVWTEHGSPLLNIARRQAEAVQRALDDRFNGPLRVELAMRYGTPSIADGLEALRAAGARRVLVLPLYPQYAAATTASTFDAVARVLAGWRWIPELRMVTHYHDHPGYIRALADSVHDHWAAGTRPERLLFSFHGIPRECFLEGDPYHCECQKTARLVAEDLQLADGEWAVSFQSRFGPKEWLQPYTDETLKRWGGEGIKHVDVICPGFSADCLETLEEIAMQNRDFFLQAGGERYGYIPALNERPDHIAVLADLVATHGAGWPEFAADWDTRRAQAEAVQTQERARAMGAPR